MNISTITGYEDKYLISNRKSTDDAMNQKNSLAHQRQRNLEYAAANSLPIADLTVPGFCKDGIIDESHSAFKEEDEFVLGEDGTVTYQILRPKFAQLIELLKEKKIKGVIFLCWDRASRNKHDDLILKKLMKLGCDIRFADTNYEKSSSGELHMDIDGMFSAHYSRVISEKVQNAYKKLRAEGRCVYLSPIGYLDHGSDSKPFDPKRAPIVKRMFELYATGQWSLRSIAAWAVEQGLTTKPARRNRTKEQIADNVDVESIPKVERPVSHKIVEKMLTNRFYIGYLRVDGGWRESTAHQALIDVPLFNEVQKRLAENTKTVRHLDKPFYAFRGLLRCPCGRTYTPYEKKGKIYYRSNCHPSCENTDANLDQEDVDAAVQELMDGVSFTDEELRDIESRSKSELERISARRDSELNDLHAKRRNLLADSDYLKENRVTLLRSGMSPEDIQLELERIEVRLEGVHADIRAQGESAKEMLQYVLTLSELARNASAYYRYALDCEKRELVMQVFYELVFSDRKLVKYSAKDAFGVLLHRTVNSGAQERT